MFANPLYLLALLGIPAVVALHLYRRRFRARTVSALFLWAEAREDSMGGRRRERLVRSTSFWCEVLAALAIALVLAGPKSCSASHAGHLVVVLDGSAAMGATTDSESLLDRATKLVEERIDGVGAEGRVTLIQSGPRPFLLCGPGGLPEEARRALANFRPEAPRHDLDSAVALGLKIAGGSSVVVVSPRFEPERFSPGVELLAIGVPLENTALVRAKRSRAVDGDGERVEITAAHYGRAPITTSLRFLVGDELLAEHTLELSPDEPREFGFDLPTDTPLIEARLTEGGALTLDDSAYLAPPPPRTLAVSSTLPPDVLNRLGLSRKGGSAIARWLALIPSSIETTPELAHVVLGPPPTTAGEPWTGVALMLEAPTEERKDWIGPFLIEKRHPLLSGVTLEGVVWSASPSLRLEGSPLVAAGNTPLLVERNESGQRLFQANFDARRSTLIRSPDWPILLANLAELARQELPGPERTSLATGEPFVYRARREATYRLVGPDIDRELRAREVLILEEDVARPGVYELFRADRSLCRFGVSFADSGASDLRELASGERASSTALAQLESGDTPVQRALLLLLLGLLALDWYWLSRRRRSSPAAEVLA